MLFKHLTSPYYSYIVMGHIKPSDLRKIWLAVRQLWLGQRRTVMCWDYLERVWWDLSVNRVISGHDELLWNMKSRYSDNKSQALTVWPKWASLSFLRLDSFVIIFFSYLCDTYAYYRNPWRWWDWMDGSTGLHGSPSTYSSSWSVCPFWPCSSPSQRPRGKSSAKPTPSSCFSSYLSTPWRLYHSALPLVSSFPKVTCIVCTPHHC